MQFIRDMKLSSRLFTSYLIVIVVSIAIGVVGITGMAALSKADEEIYLYNTKSLSTITKLYDLLAMQRINSSNMVLFYDSDKDFSTSEGNDLVKNEKAYNDALLDYKNSIANKDEDAILSNLQAASSGDFSASVQDVKKAVASGVSADMIAAIKKLDDAGSKVSDYLDQACQLNDNMAASKVSSNKQLSEFRTILLLIAMAIGILISMAMAMLISNSVAKPLGAISGALRTFASTGRIVLPGALAKAVSEVTKQKDELGAAARDYEGMMERFSYLSGELDKIAEGNLTSEIVIASEYDAMGLSLNKVIDNLNAMFDEISSSTKQVSTGADQIAGVAQTLAQGATEQAASIDGLSESITKISVETKEKAGNGTKKMDQMVQSVEDIDQASNEIGKIIKIINDIAFQTNILALNASVEAARAGAHGKGFAVVAEEVKNLANRSQKAANETDQLIANSLKLADDGANIARETQSALESIIVTVDKLNEVMTGIEQISVVVQQNSATAQESAAASEEMSSQSSTMHAMLQKFKLKNAVSSPPERRRLPYSA